MNLLSNHDEKTVAIITARGGSKRIPGKNIREFCGKPILSYSIEAALKSGAFDEVMVSTDSDEIAEIALKYGADVPFRRSSEMAGDFATTDEVIAEVLEEFDRRTQMGCSEDNFRRTNYAGNPENKSSGKVFSGEHVFQKFCCIYPTAPFLTPGRLRKAMQLLEEHESVLPVVKFSYPPQRGFVKLANQCVARWMPQYAAVRSQDLEPIYHDAGQFYACRTDAFFRGRTTDVEDMVPLVLPETEVQDIDTFEDWAIAEEKFRQLRGKQSCHYM